MSAIIILATLILSILISLGLVYISFKFSELSEEDLDQGNDMNRFELLPLQIGYYEVRGWR